MSLFVRGFGILIDHVEKIFVGNRCKASKRRIVRRENEIEKEKAEAIWS